MKNCECCLGTYGSYKVGTESEVLSSWSEYPKYTKTETGFVMDTPQGKCPFCNPSSAMWYLPNKDCHNKNNV